MRSHHERWDGQGYPDGLGGEAIPPLARVVALADAFDAMTSDRPYRKGMPAAVGLRRDREAGRQAVRPGLRRRLPGHPRQPSTREMQSQTASAAHSTRKLRPVTV